MSAKTAAEGAESLRMRPRFTIEVPMPALTGPTPDERAKAKATKDTEKRRRAGAKAPEPKAEKTAEDAKGRTAETAPVA